jgi:hypothetical protein
MPTERAKMEKSFMNIVRFLGYFLLRILKISYNTTVGEFNEYPVPILRSDVKMLALSSDANDYGKITQYASTDATTK